VKPLFAFADESSSYQPNGRWIAMTDAEVVRWAQRGYQDAAEHLLYKYRNLVRSKVKSYFLIGAEREDLLQVGMIGLWQAIVDFKPSRATSFPAFAKVCIHRHIITAIKAATRQKQIPLNQSISLEFSGDDDGSDWSVSDLLRSPEAQDLAEMLITREDTRKRERMLQELLSEFEWRVLARYQMGQSYREIADSLFCKTKSVDNALARIKRKVGHLITDGDLSALHLEF